MVLNLNDIIEGWTNLEKIDADRRINGLILSIFLKYKIYFNIRFMVSDQGIIIRYPFPLLEWCETSFN